MLEENQIELVLFEHHVPAVEHFLSQGITSFIVDLECEGKKARQKGFNTEINQGHISDVNAISKIAGTKVWCRINRYGHHTSEEVKSAIGAGAHVLILPMVTAIDEVFRFIRLIDSHCEACIMIETPEAASLSGQFNKMPLTYAFFGLNDFAICREDNFIFRAVGDGTVEMVRKEVHTLRFGFGGLTDIRLGSPIPAVRLIEELARLQCTFTFLRRSFRRDCKTTSPAQVVKGIRDYWEACCGRTEDKDKKDHTELVRLIDNLINTPI